MKLNVYTQHFGRNFNLAYPVMLSQAGHMLVGVADSMMVGRLGAEPLAAASLANVIFSITISLGIGITYAVTPLVAKADGENNLEGIADVLKHGTVINVLAALVLFALLIGGSYSLPYLDQPEEVVVLAGPYLAIIASSIIPLMIFQNYRQFAEGLSLTKQAMRVSLIGNLANIILNYILIFGKLGFEPMGLNGAGWATLIARSGMALAMFGYIFLAPRFRNFRLGFVFREFRAKLFDRMLRIGVPAGIQFIFEVGAFGFAAVMMGWLGAEQLAAHQIAINLAALTYMMASGLSATAAIRVGNQVGRKDRGMLRDVTFSIYIMVVLFMSIFAVVFVTGWEFLPTLYISNAEVERIAAGLLIIAALFQISDGVQVVGLGALRGMADTRIPTWIAFLAYWLIGIPVSYVLGFVMDAGAIGIWVGLSLGLTVAAVTLFLRFNKLSARLEF